MKLDLDIIAMAEAVSNTAREEVSVSLTLAEWASVIACMEWQIKHHESDVNMIRLAQTVYKIESHFKD